MKKKLSIQNLKVESFVTQVDTKITVKGGTGGGGATMGPMAEICTNTVWPMNSACMRCSNITD